LTIDIRYRADRLYTDITIRTFLVSFLIVSVLAHAAVPCACELCDLISLLSEYIYALLSNSSSERSSDRGKHWQRAQSTLHTMECLGEGSLHISNRGIGHTVRRHAPEGNQDGFVFLERGCRDLPDLPTHLFFPHVNAHAAKTCSEKVAVHALRCLACAWTRERRHQFVAHGALIHVFSES